MIFIVTFTGRHISKTKTLVASSDNDLVDQIAHILSAANWDDAHVSLIYAVPEFCHITNKDSKTSKSKKRNNEN
jgi:hypothetical protein